MVKKAFWSTGIDKGRSEVGGVQIWAARDTPALEIDFRFALSDNELSSEGEVEIQKRRCQLYPRPTRQSRARIWARRPFRKDEIVLVIEGHSDSQTTQKSILSAKERNSLQLGVKQ